MTKKHFKAIAEIIKYSEDKQDIMIKLANYFAQENPRFDRERFVDACLIMAE